MKRFTIETDFAAPVEAVEALIFHPELHQRLIAAMPAIRAIEVLSVEERGHEVHTRVRYTPNSEGKIPAFARGAVKPEMLCWTEEAVYDRRAHRLRYRNIPAIPEGWRDRFDSHGEYVLTPTATGTHRRIDGEIHVRVPLLGGVVEKMLVKEVETNFRAEAQALANWLAERV